MTWTRGCTVVVREVRGYGWVPIVYHGLDLGCVTPAGVRGYAFEWAPVPMMLSRPTIRAGRLMARCRAWE